MHDIVRWRRLIAATPARLRIEQLIADRVAEALRPVAAAPVDDFVEGALSDLALRCTGRDR
ncbi:hypothetical protein [Saccharopolyspora sp. CA-218241]|uniref:hypothetical protein n=1 Tax=Saccharopolyspora sp. CA-218241 TaxID=3240027 RepID=UPI003D997696